MGDQFETFCFDWASLEPVYLNTLEMAFLELVLVCPSTVESWWMYLFPLSRKSPRSMSLVPVRRRSPAASASSPSDGGAAGRPACSSSDVRVAGDRACFPSASGAPETVLARAKTEALLETVSVVTLPGDLRRVLVEEPSEIVWLPPLKLLSMILPAFHSIACFLHSLLLVSVEMVVCFFTPCI